MTGCIECTITSHTFALGQRIKDRKIGVQYEAPPYIREVVKLFGYATQPGAERSNATIMERSLSLRDNFKIEVHQL